jgi:hypothetical protein
MTEIISKSIKKADSQLSEAQTTGLLLKSSQRKFESIKEDQKSRKPAKLKS